MKNQTFVLRAAALLAILCLATSPLMAAAIAQQVQPGTIVTCEGIKPKEGELPGIGVVSIVSNGHISSRVGSTITAPNGQAATELTIVGFSDSGSSEGLGSYDFSLDGRKAGPSWVQQNEDGTLTQVMNFHLTANIEALGNEPVRTVRPASMASDLKTFPQTGAVYYMLEPIEFVDASGKVRLRIHDASVKMTDTHTF